MDVSTACLIAALSVSPGSGAGKPDNLASRLFVEPAASLFDQVPLPPPKSGRFKFLQQVGGDFKHFPSWDTAAWLAVGGGLSLAVHPVDDDSECAAGQARRVLQRRAVHWIALRAGRSRDRDVHRRPHDSQRESQAPGNGFLSSQIVTQTFTQALKITVRRERPDHSDKHSFPSGHASATFASATVLQRHLGWKAALPTYTIASYVAISRMHENRHHLSDVVFGAALGIAAGRTTTRHGREHWSLIPTFGKDAVGLMVLRNP